nr:unnamed protein product [Callosobruchus chinensis]
MMSATKISPRTRKRRFREEMKEQIVAQVHKAVVSNDSTEESGPEGNRTYTKNEDTKNENVSIHTPSRDISVDGETQINSKILSLIETEMKRDINKHSHFTDSRPQSLSFYEDEKIPEELSGNLELLSPEERKHYKKKNYIPMDPEEMNAYNTLQDSYMARDAEDIMSSSLKKAKSRKKRHADSEMGMGDSREMMIPKEKKKSKKKKRETSPAASNNTKRKHKRKEEDELKNDVAVALDELQDDVFEHDHDQELSTKADRIRRSPRKTDKLFVQKKNKFEVITKPNLYPGRNGDVEGDKFGKRTSTYPVEIALTFQNYWMRLSTLCHGLLGGLALGHWLYLVCNVHQQDYEFLLHYAYYSDTYVGLFFALTVLCLVSMYDRIDIVRLNKDYVRDLWKQRRSSVVIFLYLACFLIHLSMTNYDDKLALLVYDKHNNVSNETTVTTMIKKNDLEIWNNLSLWRAILAFTAWIFIGLGPPDDMLYHHLKSTEAYLPIK